MSTPNSIQFAINTLEKINSVSRQSRNMAKSFLKTLSEVDSSIVNPEKKKILADGLNGLSVSPADLKSKKDKLQMVFQYILDNVDELTE